MIRDPSPINRLPQDGRVLYYGPIFEPTEAAQYFQILLDTIPWQQDELVMFGRKIITQRETAWYGDRPYAYTYSHATKTALPWTPALRAIKQWTEDISGESYNACLLNLYHDGSKGMGWHSDNEDTIVPRSAIASVSLGAARRFDLRHNRSKEKVSVDLANGSLLVMHGDTQAHWQHSLPKALRIREARINLTFRQMKE